VGGDRALDLDDVELVQMLLKEEKTDLNSTYALHYAAMYCDPKIMADLLRLEIAGDMHVCCKLTHQSACFSFIPLVCYIGSKLNLLASMANLLLSYSSRTTFAYSGCLIQTQI
jgi:hypothetical protein